MGKPKQLVIAFAGVLAFIVGSFGLLLPVAVASPTDNAIVGCGSAVFSQLAGAQARDDADTTLNQFDPYSGDVGACRNALADRRLWTSITAVVGVIAFVAWYPRKGQSQPESAVET